MKLLLDQGLPRTAVDRLRDLGIEAEHVGNLGLAAATDEEILKTASDRNAVIVTLDADFHGLLARSRATSPSFVRIRVEGLKAAELATLVAEVLSVAATE
jgi:predicted nuclease of predicted toxin-antitoxin system